MKLAGRWRNVERRGPRTHIRGQLMATIADSSPLTESTLLRALIAVWVLFDAYEPLAFHTSNREPFYEVLLKAKEHDHGHDGCFHCPCSYHGPVG